MLIRYHNGGVPDSCINLAAIIDAVGRLHQIKTPDRVRVAKIQSAPLSYELIVDFEDGSVYQTVILLDDFENPLINIENAIAFRSDVFDLLHSLRQVISRVVSQEVDVDDIDIKIKAG